MSYQSINLAEKLTRFSDLWAPKVVAEMNDYQLKLVKVCGEFVWHTHAHTDEVFHVLTGSLDIWFRDGKVTVNAGEIYVVPKGVEHMPIAAQECHLLLVEPKGVVNTGDASSDKTAQQDVWV